VRKHRPLWRTAVFSTPQAATLSGTCHPWYSSPPLKPCHQHRRVLPRHARSSSAAAEDCPRRRQESSHGNVFLVPLVPCLEAEDILLRLCLRDEALRHRRKQDGLTWSGSAADGGAIRRWPGLFQSGSEVSHVAICSDEVRRVGAPHLLQNPASTHEPLKCQQKCTSGEVRH